MSMYKTIFVTEAENQAAAGEQIFSVNGEVSLTGESAFTSLENAVAAVAAVTDKAIVIKVASGKYESFTVEGTETTAVSAIAVDFSGGTVMIDGKEVTVADSGIGADAQATILADLNAKNAANGKVFVAANEVTAGLPTLYVGMDENGYAVGTSVAGVYTANAGDIANIITGESEISTIAVDSELRVGSQYSSYDAAWDYYKANGQAKVFGIPTGWWYDSAIVVESGKEITISNDHKDYNKLDIVAEKGSTVKYAGNLLKMTYDVTINGGATLKSTRSKSSTTTYTHIDGGSLTLKGTSKDNLAVFDFGSDADYRSSDVAVLYDGKFTAEYATIKTGDLGFTGNATMTNCTVDVEGIVAFGKVNGNVIDGKYKQTMTNTTMTVAGNSLRNDATYFNPDGTYINNLTMVNSSIVVDDGAEGTAAQKVTVKTLTMEKGSSITADTAIEITGTVVLDSSCTLTADSMTFGNSGAIKIDLLDGFTGGKIIDITGKTGLTEDILNKLIADNKITITGTGKDDFGLTIQEGDIYVMKGVGIKDNTLDLTENKAETFTGTIGNANDDLTITSTGTATSETATINADVKAKDVTLTNSKDLNVAGSVNASGDMDITNAAGATIKGTGSLTASGDINMTNDGHAEVKLNAKEIAIQNNSANTIANSSIGYDANGNVSAEKVTITAKENADGVITDSKIGATGSVNIADQTVTNTVVDGNVAIENTIVNGGTLGGTDDIVSVVGSGTSKIDTVLDVKTFEVRDGADFTNTKNITAEAVYVGYNNQVPSSEANSDGKFTVAEGTTVTGWHEGVYVRPDAELEVEGTLKTSYVQLKDSSATINKGGEMILTGTNGIWVRGESELNVNGGEVVAEGLDSENNNIIIDLEKNSALNLDGGTLNLLNNGGNASTDGINVADGATVSVKDSSIAVTNIANNGTFTVSGESSLNIGSLTGTMNVADNAIIKNSNVTGGDASLASNVTFRGDNVWNLSSQGSYATNITVEKGATLNAVSGGRFTMGGGNTFTAAGELAVGTATQLSAEELANTKKTLNLSGFSLSTSGTNTLNISNAYAVMGNVSTASSARGIYNFNFTNSYVELANTNRFQIQTGSSNISGFNMTVDGSVVSAKAGFTQKYAGGVIELKNGAKLVMNNSSYGIESAGTIIATDSAIEAAVITNSGTITINDSTITAGTIKNTGSINISVSAGFLAGMTDDLAIISQTNANAAALNAGVKFGDTVYQLGDYVTTIGNNDYYLTKGDGNDIVLDVRKDKIYVNSDGSGDFKTFEEARAYATKYAPTATIVVQETDGINQIEGGIRNLPEMNIVIEDGAELAIGYNSMKLTQDVTIKAGGFLGNSRNEKDGWGNLQIEGSDMVVGEAGADKKAELDLYKGNKYVAGHTGGQSLIVKENSSFTANNAKIEFSDFTANGAASFTDTEATVQGTVALGWDRTDSKGTFFKAENATMTNTTMKVVGNGPLKGDGYGQPVNSFDKLTMTNSSITVDDLKDGSAAADVVIGNVSMKDGSSFTIEEGTNVSVTEQLTIDNSSFSAGTVANSGKINVFNSTLSNVEFAGSGDTYIRAEGAKLNNLTVSGQETYTINTDFNGGSFSGGTVYTGAELVDGKWVRKADSESTITGTVDASSVYWQNYGKLTIAEGAELKTSYFSEGSKQVLTVNGTISAGTFRGYNGLVSETGRINAQSAAQFYGNPTTQQQYDINGELIVTHDISYTHNFVVGFDTAKQWWGTGPNDYWNIGGANTVVNVSGEKAKVEVNAGTAGKTTAIIHVDEENTRATLNVSNGAEFSVDGKLINNGNLNISSADAAVTGTVTNAGSITVAGESTLNLANVVKGSNAIQILDGATLKDSTIGGEAGYVWIMEDATFKGNLSITGVNLYGQEAANLTIADGATLSVTDLVLRDGSTMNIYGDVVSSGISVGGTINIGGGSLTGYLENYHPDVEAVVNMSDGAALKLTNAYKDVTVNMDATSSLTLSGTVYDNIEVNLTGFAIGSGDFTVVNMTSNGAAANVSLTINGTSYNVGDKFTYGDMIYNITNGDGNDIIIDAEADTIFVDASYDENTVGFGFNKFNSFTDAMVAASENSSIKEIKISSDITEAMPTDIFFKVTNDVKITADSAVSVHLTNDGTKNDIVMGSLNGSHIAVGENVSIKLDGRPIWFGHQGYVGESYIDIYGVVDGGQWWNGQNTTVHAGGKLISSSEAMVFRNGATLTVNGDAAQGAAAEDRTVQLDANYMTIISGGIDAKNTSIKAGQIWFDSTTYPTEGKAWIKLDNTVMSSTGSLKLNRADSSALMELTNGSTLTVSGSGSTIGNKGTLSISDSTASLKDLTNAGKIDVTGNSTFKADKLTSTSETPVAFGSTSEERSNIELGSVSGKGLNMTASRVNIYNADVTLTDNVSVTTTGVLSKILDANVDMNGNTLTYTGFTVLDSASGLGSNTGVTLSDGTFNVNTNHLCFQGYDHVISSDAVVNVDTSMHNSGMVNVYGSLTIEGKVNVTHGNYGYDNVGTTDGHPENGWPKSSYPESILTVKGANASYTINNGHMFRVIHETAQTGAGTLNVIDGASFSFTGSREGTGLFFNSNRVYVDAASSFTVDSYYGNAEGKSNLKGAFNSENAGEMVVLGNVTVNKQLVTDSLIINQGGALTVGSITVTDLTIAIGGELTLNGNATVSSGYINVIGELKPENAAYTLVTNGWDKLSGLQIRYDINNDNVYSTDEMFTVGTAGKDGYLFTVNGDSLYISKQDANITGIYIGNDVSGKADGTTFIADDGAKYTVGVDAFASMDAAKAAISDKSLVTSLTLGSADLVSAAKAEFVNLNDIRVEAGVTITDTAASEFTGDLNIDNDGHLDATIKVTDGGLTFTNTSDQTLLGSYTATNAIVGTNSGTMGGNYTSKEAGITIDNTFGNINDATTFTAGGVVDITGGDAGNVTVTANGLHLTDTNSFGLNASSSVLTATGSVSNNMWGVNGGASAIQLFGSANLSINGDASITAGIEAQLDDHTGTVTFNGNQTYTGDIAANKFVVAENGNVTVNSNQFDFNELNIAGTLSTDFTKHDAFTSQDTFTTAGSITGAGNFITTHGGDWVINDTVERNFSGFTGTVSMADANASIVMGKGDAVVGSTVSSYFSDDATVVVNGDQSVVLAKDGVNTAIDFKGDGIINVGDYTDGAFAEQSTGFTQTLSGTNTGFTGTVNVSEGAALTIESKINASEINLDAPSVADTGDVDATKLILDAADVITEAKLSGDTNDIIDVNADQTLNKLGALDAFAGTVDLDVSKLTLTDENDTAAKFIGTGIIDANADLTLSAAAALNGFSGTVELEGDKLTLEGVNETSAKFTGTGTIDADANQTLKATGAIDGFSGTVDLGANELTLEGVNYTDAKFSGTGIIDANADQILNAAGALDDFSGIVELEANELTLNAENITSATFNGTGIIDVNANQTLNGAGALNNFSGKVELENNSMTLNGVNTTSAEFVGGADAELNVNANQFLNADNTNFDGKLNINSKAEVQFNGDFGTVGGNSTINFNANESSIYVAPGYAVDINSKLVSNTVTGEIFYIGGEATLTADGALDKFDGTLRLSDKDAAKLILEGDNSTAATFYSVNYNTKHTVELNGGDLTLTNNDALKDFYGAIKVNSNQITFDAASGSFADTSATFTGNSDAVMNVNDSITLLGTPNPTTKNTGKDAISGFAGTINIADNATLTIDSKNTTAAKFVSENGTLIFAATDMAAANTLTSAGALDNMNGNITLSSGAGLNSGATLVLDGINTTGANIRGDEKSVIKANADQYFTGNVSSFSGTYDIASGAEVTLSGTIADTINAKGDTLTLSNVTGKDVTVNAATGADLDNLAFGANNVTLGAGDGDDFTNVTGTGDIVDFGKDQTFGTVTAGTIFVTGSQDELSIADLTANVNITIDAAQAADALADVTVNGAFTGSITVNVADGDFVGDGYKLATNSAFTTASTITLTVGTAAEVTLQVDERKVIGDKSYLLQLKDETLILTQMPGYSNYVAVNGGWSSKVPYQAVIDGTTERIIGYDAAASLDSAAEYIKGYDTGINDLAGTNLGDATMELVKGTYKLSDGKYLMTEANEVTQLDLVGRAGNKVTINGTLRGSDGSKATSMLIKNISTTGFVFAGGDLTINNSASVKTSGNAIAAGIAADAGTKTMVNDSTLTINGGNFTTSVLTGGSVAYGDGAVVNVEGDTSVVIDNQSGEKLTITSNIFGGSYAAQGTVNQTGDASITVKADQATVIRGDIYVSGAAGLGTLNMSGNSYITFTGDASKLTFTGTVSAIQSAKAEIATFDNFSGKFNGSLVGFDSVVISGGSSLSFGRRQTETSNTGLVFNVNDSTSAAMYTVRDANAWEFSKSITINTDVTVSGTSEYVIVNNYNAGFDGFTFNVNGNAYTSITDAGLTYENGTLSYKLTTINVGDTNSATNLAGNINITGLEGTSGAKTIAGVDETLLSNATIENQTAETDGFFQLAGADTVETADDIWARIGENTSTGDALVAWGTSKDSVNSAIAEFNNTQSQSLVDNTQAVAAATDDLLDNKKNNGSNGTLA